MRISSLLTLAGAIFVATSAHASIVLLQNFDGQGVVTGPSGTSTVFRQPSFSGSTAGKLDTTTYNVSEISPEQSVSAPNSLKVAFQFKDGTLDSNWVRLTTSGANPVLDMAGSVGFKALLMPVEPGAALDPLGIAIGIRETNTPADAPIGSVGSGTSGAGGGIEWLGVTDATGGAPNPTRWLQPGVWTEFYFVPQLEPITSFVGNGILNPINGTKVTWEQLALRALPQAGTAGAPGTPFILYLDDVVASDTRNEIPEPATLSLLGLGLLPLIRRKR